MSQYVRQPSPIARGSLWRGTRLVKPASVDPRLWRPTLVAESESAWNLSTEPLTVSVDVLTDDLLVVCAISADWTDSTDTFLAPTGGSLTYTELQQIAIDDRCGVGVWWARATSNATFNVSVELSGSPDALFGMNVLIYRGSDGIGATAQANGVTAAPQISLAIQSERSGLIAVIGDWNAVDGASRDWLAVNGYEPASGNAWEKTYSFQSLEYTAYIGVWPEPGSGGSKTLGLSTPNTTQYAIIGVEVLGQLPPDTDVHNDDFVDQIYWGFWDDVDPVGDVLWTPQASTMRVAAPAGDHDWWTGVGESGKLAQYVDPGWTGPLITKLSAVPDNGVTGASAIYGAGLFIDDGDYLDGIRFEILRWSDDTLKAFGAVINAGTATGVVDAAITTDVYLRLSKSGTTYTFATSTDGSSWTTHDNVVWSGSPSRIGVHVITSQTTSTYTQDFDFFEGEAAAGGATATPATVTATTTINTPSIIASSIIAAATVNGTTTIPTPTVNAGAGATPATVQGTATIPTPTIQAGGATAAPTTVNGAASIPTPTIVAGSTVTAATVAGTATIPTPTISAGAVATPATVSGVATIPTPAISAGGSATVVATTVSATTTINTPSIIAGSTIAAAVVSGSTTIPTPTIRAGSTVIATTVVGTATIPTPVVSAGGSATIVAVTVTAVATIPTPTIQAGVTIAATTVTGSTTIPTPSIRLGVIVTPATVTAAAVIPTPTVVAGSRVAATTVLATTTIPVPTIRAVTTTLPATVVGIASIFLPAIIASSRIPAVTVIATSSIPFPTIVAIIPPPLPSDYDINTTTTILALNGQSIGSVDVGNSIGVDTTASV